MYGFIMQQFHLLFEEQCCSLKNYTQAGMFQVSQICRFCVEYHQFNAVTKMDVFPLLCIDYTLDLLSKVAITPQQK